MANGPRFTFNTGKFSAVIRKKLREHPEKAKKAMNEIRDLLVVEVKKRTPIEEGHLTNSVTGSVEQHSKSWSAKVYIPSNSPAAAYAVWLHECDYSLGKSSIAKQSESGCVVGPGYITRAISENKDKITQIMKDVLKK